MSDRNYIKYDADVSYLFHKNNRPVTIISCVPNVENKFYVETMDETLRKLTSHFDNRFDPTNEGKTFKFNNMSDFYLNTRERQTAFIYVCKKITLSPRLTKANEIVMQESLNNN